MTRAALYATARVKSAAGCATNVHRAREPTRDERAESQDPDQDRGVQQEVFQPLPFSEVLV